MRTQINEISIIINRKQAEKLISELSTLDRKEFDILIDLKDYIKGGFKQL